MHTLGIIGCGTMGSAIARSLEDTALVFDNDHEKALALASSKLRVADSMEQLLTSCTAILIAVKPQVLPSLYPLFRAHDSSSKLWVSIAAGVPLSVLSEQLGTQKVVRFMPNIAAAQRAAVTAYAAHPGCPDADRAYAAKVAGSFGKAFPLDENQFSAFIGISGSAIAFMLQFCHALAMGGVLEGIPYQQALQIVNATMQSTIALLDNGASHPAALATSVCSAGGTTIEGMRTLMEEGFDGIVMKAVAATSGKSRILEEKAKKTTETIKQGV